MQTQHGSSSKAVCTARCKGRACVCLRWDAREGMRTRENGTHAGGSFGSLKVARRTLGSPPAAGSSLCTLGASVNRRLRDPSSFPPFAAAKASAGPPGVFSGELRSVSGTETRGVARLRFTCGVVCG